MRALPPLDLHAHIETTIDPQELVTLDSVVFAVTRSLDEAHAALSRRDLTTVWGVGCHPGMVSAQKSFSSHLFAELVEKAAFVGEVGLDGKSLVPMTLQIETLRSICKVLTTKSRICTIHSYLACDEVLAVLTEFRPAGAVLHWWLGSPEQTARAVELGCYFSINAAMLKHRDRLKMIPSERWLTETDHPFGDRAIGPGRRPGRVDVIEDFLSDLDGRSAAEVRLQCWRNLATLVHEVSVGALLPRGLRTRLAALHPNVPSRRPEGASGADAGPLAGGESG